MNTIKLSRAFCNDCLAQCFFEHNENTSQTSHVEDFTRRSAELQAQGYINAGHHNGVITWHQRNTKLTALPLDWQMASEERDLVDVEQDW